MPNFSPVPISKKQIKADLKDFRAPLDDPSRPDLSESKDILPFFKGHPQLCAFVGTHNPSIDDFKNIVTASEFDLFGDHVADLAVGDTTRHEYCFIISKTPVHRTSSGRHRKRPRNGRRDSSTASANSSIGYSGSKTIRGMPPSRIGSASGASIMSCCCLSAGTNTSPIQASGIGSPGETRAFSSRASKSIASPSTHYMKI
jgi:hypothetical protein